MMKLAFASALLGVATQAASGTYVYNTNGADWGVAGADGNVEEGHELCSTGTEQSPIDLPTKDFESDEVMSLTGYDYFNFVVPPTVGNDLGKAYTINLPAGDKKAAAELAITFPDASTATFEPAQFHFHAPSEHTKKDKTLDLEMHIVHLYKANAGLGAVIGVFFDQEEGGKDENPFLKSVIESIQERDSTADREIDMVGLLETVDFGNYYSYNGSLTTPPCTEGIKWNVIQKAQSISDEQLAFFEKDLAKKETFANGKGNNRQTMPINDRKVYFTDGNSTRDGATQMLAGVAFLVSALALF